MSYIQFLCLVCCVVLMLPSITFPSETLTYDGTLNDPGQSDVRPVHHARHTASAAADVYAAQDAQDVQGSHDAPLHEHAVSEELIRRLEHRTDLDEALSLTLPLSPEDVRIARERKEAFDSAAAPRPARMHTATRQIRTTPGSAPQIVRLTQGYTSTIIFQDATGRPWPVLSLVLGNPQAFSALQARTQKPRSTAGQDLQQPENTGQKRTSRTGRSEQHALPDTDENATGHILHIVPRTERGSSNMAITLEDCPYPVILHLLTDSPLRGERTSDALIVFRLDSAGPRAVLPHPGPAFRTDAVTEETLSFVHALPPRGARLLTVDPPLPGLRIWEYRNRFYLRTHVPLIWPAWTQIVSGEDMQVYVLPRTRSIVVSRDGTYTTLRITGK